MLLLLLFGVVVVEIDDNDVVDTVDVVDDSGVVDAVVIVIEVDVADNVEIGVNDVVIVIGVVVVVETIDDNDVVDAVVIVDVDINLEDEKLKRRGRGGGRIPDVS